MKLELKKIILKDNEPVYALSGYLQQLSEERKSEFWVGIQQIIHEGDEREKLIGLNLVSLEENELQAIVIDTLVGKIDPVNYSELVIPTIRIIKNLRRKDLVTFCLKVLNAAMDRVDFKTMEISFRALLELDWKSVFNEIIKRIERGTSNQVIDTMAYFRHTHAKSEWEEMLGMLNEWHRKKLETLENEIQFRCKNHYERLS